MERETEAPGGVAAPRASQTIRSGSYEITGALVSSARAALRRKEMHHDLNTDLL